MRSGLVFLLIVYALLLLYFANYWISQLQPVNVSRKNPIVAADKLDLAPGDLVLMRYFETSQMMQRTPWWIHVGLCFRDTDGVVRVADYNPKSSHNPYNLHVFTLEERLAGVKDSTVFAVRKLVGKLGDAQNDAMRAFILQSKHKQMARYIPGVFCINTMMNLGDGRFERDSCTSFVLRALNAAGVTDEQPWQFPCSAFSSQSKFKRLRMAKGYAYAPEVYIDKTPFACTYPTARGLSMKSTYGKYAPRTLAAAGEGADKTKRAATAVVAQHRGTGLFSIIFYARAYGPAVSEYAVMVRGGNADTAFAAREDAFAYMVSRYRGPQHKTYRYIRDKPATHEYIF